MIDNRLRIGVDREFKWGIKTNGEFESLKGRDLTLVMTSNFGLQCRVPFDIVDDYYVRFFYYGKDQHEYGTFSLVLWENLGKEYQTVAELNKAFELVYSYSKENTDAIEEMTIESTTLQTANFVTGVRGLSAYEVAKKNGFNGSEGEWLASLKGLKGERGLKGEQGEKGEPFRYTDFTEFQIAYLQKPAKDAASKLESKFILELSDLKSNFEDKSASLETDFAVKTNALEDDYKNRLANLENNYSGTTSNLQSEFGTIKAALEEEYATTKTSLETDYNTAKDAIRAEYEQGLTEINDRYAQLQTNLSTEYSAKQTALEITINNKKNELENKVNTAVGNIPTDIISEAPLDGKQYARKDGLWTEVEASGGGYEPPVGGIPKGDLSASVQASLNKADTALQTHIDISGKANVGDSYTKAESDSKYLTEHQDISGKADKATTYTKSEVDSLIASVEGGDGVQSGVLSVNGQTGVVNLSIPTKVSDLTNDSGYLTEHQSLASKQDVISDLATIRSGASAGATAVQPSAISDMETKTNAAATYQTKITSSNKIPYSNISGTPSAVTESTVSGWGFTKNSGTYSKPSGGIPKSDLASAVQTSLGKADTALQEHQDISGKANANEAVHCTSESSVTAPDFEDVIMSALNNRYTKSEVDNMIGNVESLLEALL